jgi:hypothetical protein
MKKSSQFDDRFERITTELLDELGYSHIGSMFSTILGLAFYDWFSNKVKGHCVLGKSAEQADKN